MTDEPLTAGGALAGDALAVACAQAMLSRDRASMQMGVVIREAREGFVRLTMTIGETMTNGHGTAHGGVIFAFADSAFAFACNSRNVPHVALGATISFTTAARLGDVLEATAEERTLGGRTGVYDVNVVRAGTAELVAVFRGTCYRIRGSVLE
jgi:acyl-CoA thioesterase